MSEQQKITPRASDYSQWYQDVIAAAGLAENSPVRGCMVIKPAGYAIWENMQKVLDRMFKETGAQNAYFPLFVPLSFLSKEAEHVRGFAKEVAVVTHHRLEADEQGNLKPAAPLEEPLIIRPTSETIIYDAFSRWISSYRDLPLLINQWCNVVRWEMRPRLFLRTTEFLWQEGHTAHASQPEAAGRSRQMLNVYQKFSEEYLAIPVIAGRKTEAEKFAGAVYTLSLEGMMQDGKALQMGTSHLLGQNFARAFNVRFSDEKGKLQYVWQTSWGVSTRMIGALIMAHSDDKGLVLPPKIAPVAASIILIGADAQLAAGAAGIKKDLEKKLAVKIEIDSRDLRPGAKFYDWERQGIPIRLDLGKKELENKTVIMVRRDTGEKEEVKIADLGGKLVKVLDEIQANLYERAQGFLKKNTYQAENWKDLQSVIQDKKGFAEISFCAGESCEEKIQKDLRAGIRCLPFSDPSPKGEICAVCGQPAKQSAIVARAY